jgi:hypothetical protein
MEPRIEILRELMLKEYGDDLESRERWKEADLENKDRAS